MSSGAESEELISNKHETAFSPVPLGFNKTKQTPESKKESGGKALHTRINILTPSTDENKAYP